MSDSFLGCPHSCKKKSGEWEMTVPAASISNETVGLQTSGTCPHPSCDSRITAVTKRQDRSVRVNFSSLKTSSSAATLQVDRRKKQAHGYPL